MNRQQCDVACYELLILNTSFQPNDAFVDYLRRSSRPTHLMCEPIIALWETWPVLQALWRGGTSCEIERRLRPHANRCYAILARFQSDSSYPLSEAQRVLLEWLASQRTAIDPAPLGKETAAARLAAEQKEEEAAVRAEKETEQAEEELALRWRKLLTAENVRAKIADARSAGKEHVCLLRHWRSERAGLDYERVIDRELAQGLSVRQHLTELCVLMPEVKIYLHAAGEKCNPDRSVGLWLTWFPYFCEWGPFAFYSRTHIFFWFFFLVSFFACVATSFIQPGMILPALFNLLGVVLFATDGVTTVKRPAKTQ